MLRSSKASIIRLRRHEKAGEGGWVNPPSHSWKGGLDAQAPTWKYKSATLHSDVDCDCVMPVVARHRLGNYPRPHSPFSAMADECPTLQRLSVAREQFRRESMMHTHLLIFYFLGAVAFTLGRLGYDEWREMRKSRHGGAGSDVSTASARSCDHP